jgi:hypothetical protein
MKQILLYIFIILVVQGRAQTRLENDSLLRQEQKNTLFVGVGYAGLMVHANISYERQIFHFDKALINARIAYGKYAEWGDDGDLIMLNWAYLFGRKKHYFEADFGVFARISSIDASMSMYNKNLFAKYDFYPLVNIGYRYYNPKKHFSLRSGIGTEYLYLGLGFSF